MKAKIKATGEVLNVIDVDSERVLVKYESDAKSLRIHEVDLMPEPHVFNKEIDWEQRRYELAKDFMSAMIASPTYKYCKALEYDVNKPLREHQDGLAKNAIIYTDRLIAELRKPNPDDEFSSIVEQAPNLFKALKEIAETDTNLDILGWSGKIKTIARDAINRCKKGGKE